MHFINVQSLSASEMLALMDRANTFRETVLADQKQLDMAKGKLVVHLFMEPSTRSLNAFVVAAKRLGCMTITPDLKNASLLKGETLLDTINTFIAMGANAFVIRQSEPHALKALVEQIQDKAAIINAGDGDNQHPTQTLLDLMTIRQHHGDFSSLRIAIVGDLAHSRVARSLTQGLKTLGTTDIRLVGPDSFLPDYANKENLATFDSLASGIEQADVIVTLRIQKERFHANESLNLEDYKQRFTLTTHHLKHASTHAIVMHPGPLNRGIEIASDVADGPQSVILKQVENGVAMRMAILEQVLGA